MPKVGKEFDYDHFSFRPSPTYLMVESTNECNLDCPTCSRNTLDRIGSMSYDHFVKVVDTFPNLEYVKFHGLGEPLLHRDAPKMLEYLRKKKAYTVVVSNCQWSDLELEKILSNIDHMYISVDAPNKELYEKIRVGGTWETLLANIDKILEYKKQMPHLEVIFNFVCAKNNYTYISDMLRFASKYEIDGVRFQICQTWVDSTDHPERYEFLQQSTDLTPEELAPYYKDALLVARELGVHMEIIGNRHFDFTHCVWPFERTYITWEGEVVPCCMRPDPIYAKGNIFKTSFNEIWNSDSIAEIREDLASGKGASFCKECPYLVNANFLKKLDELIIK